MSSSLANLTPGSSFPSIIKVGNNTSLTSSNQVLSDGSGNDLPIEVSSSQVTFTSGPSGTTNGLNWVYTTGRLGIGLTGPLQPLHVTGDVRFDSAGGRGLQTGNSNGFFYASNYLPDPTATNFGFGKRYNINGALYYNMTDWANGGTPNSIDATKPNSGAAALALIMDGYGGSPGFHFYAPSLTTDTISRNRMHISNTGNVSIGVLGGSGGNLSVRSTTNNSASEVLTLTNNSGSTIFSVKGDGSQAWTTGVTAAAVGITATAKIPVTINGQVYYLLASQ
jgi:hypothetical protein